MTTILTIAVVFLMICGYLMANAINILQDEINELKEKNDDGMFRY